MVQVIFAVFGVSSVVALTTVFKLLWKFLALIFAVLLPFFCCAMLCKRCLTETWIKPTTTFTELADCTPPQLYSLQFSKNLQKHILYTVYSCRWWHWIFYPWALHTITHLSHWILLLRIAVTLLFDCMIAVWLFDCMLSLSLAVTLKLTHSKISVFNIYRPPSSSIFSKSFLFFLMNLILFSLSHTSWIHHHWWL